MLLHREDFLQESDCWKRAEENRILIYFVMFVHDVTNKFLSRDSIFLRRELLVQDQ